MSGGQVFPLIQAINLIVAGEIAGIGNKPSKLLHTNAPEHQSKMDETVPILQARLVKATVRNQSATPLLF